MLSGHDLELDGAALAALIEIEVANMVEQIPRRSRKKAVRAAELYAPAFARSRDYISKPAATAAERCFDAVLAESQRVKEPLWNVGLRCAQPNLRASRASSLLQRVKSGRQRSSSLGMSSTRLHGRVR